MSDPAPPPPVKKTKHNTVGNGKVSTAQQGSIRIQLSKFWASSIETPEATKLQEMPLASTEEPTCSCCCQRSKKRIPGNLQGIKYGSAPHCHQFTLPVQLQAKSKSFHAKTAPQGSGRPWKATGERAASLRNPRLSTSWEAKMRSKAEHAQFQAARHEALAAHKEKLAVGNPFVNLSTGQIYPLAPTATVT